MLKSKFRGYDIEFVNHEWIFSDTQLPTVTTHQGRPCGHCGRHDTPEGHDGCLGVIPDVMNACCGHGVDDDMYVQFPDGSCLRGAECKKYFGELRRLYMKNTIPKMTHPMSKGWSQPSTDNILVDDTHALMSKEDCDKLLEYSRSVPSGTYEGKMWKCQFSDGLFLRWWSTADEHNCKCNQRLILLADD